MIFCTEIESTDKYNINNCNIKYNKLHSFLIPFCDKHTKIIKDFVEHRFNDKGAFAKNIYFPGLYQNDNKHIIYNFNKSIRHNLLKMTYNDPIYVKGNLHLRRSSDFYNSEYFDLCKIFYFLLALCKDNGIIEKYKFNIHNNFNTNNVYMYCLDNEVIMTSEDDPIIKSIEQYFEPMKSDKWLYLPKDKTAKFEIEIAHKSLT